MSNLGEPPVVAQAVARRAGHRVSVIWIIPLVAVAIGAWLAWDTWSKQGPTITVTFDNAEGLQAGQSQLKFKDITFGTVKSLGLSPDHSHVVVTIATTRQAEPLLTHKTVFWVVKPRLFAGAISGLQTLFSGSYIGMLPGAEPGKVQRKFTGREDPPILQAHVPGRIFYLKASRLGSISLGSPIFYRGLGVGEVLGWDIGDMAEYVTIHAFVRAPYDTYVHDNTRFWNASGLSVKLAGTGLKVEVESLRAVLLGGIAFATPQSENHVVVASREDHVFPLFADADTAEAASYTTKIPVVSYFPGSVSGLGPGSPVTIHGLVVGHVTDVRLVYDKEKDAVLAPVRFEVEPERVLGVGVRVFKNPAEGVAALLQKGLRATVQSASLITGQQQVALDFLPNAPPVKVASEDGYFVLPTAPGGGFAGLQASANDLLDKVNAIPFDQIGKNLDGILKSVNDLASGPQMRDALSKLAATLATADAFTQNLNRGTAPAFKQLPQMAAQLQKTVNNANKLLVSLDSGYGNNTRFNRDMERLLAQTNDAVASIRALADLLARHPEALIKGRPGGGVE
ncbi:MAG TPA: MlaD family protein [Stellaceae bacterium]|jgi:paraquat-inducible protein B